MKTNLKKIFSGGCVDPEAYHVSGPEQFLLTLLILCRNELYCLESQRQFSVLSKACFSVRKNAGLISLYT